MMTRLKYLTPVLCALALTGCWDKREKPAVETPYELPTEEVQDVLCDTVLTGVLGEETAMSSLQLITDSGDTLSIRKTGLDGVEGLMLGDVRNYEDRIMLSAKINVEEEIFLNTFLNVSQLEGTWKDDKTSLTLKPDSVVKSRGTNYSHWKVERCKLLLIGEHPTEYGTTQLVDTAYIDRLDADSLHLTIPRHGKLKLGKPAN